MQFNNSVILNYLWLVVPLIFLLGLSLKRRQRKMEVFIQSHLISKISPEFNLNIRRVRNWFLIVIFALSVVALARPQWGFQWQEVKKQGLDILVVMDTSKSMLTQDVKPNRLERTKLAVRDLLKRLKGDRIGLIAFSGDAFLVCPLTSDYQGFLLSLNDISTSTIPRGGTNLSSAIKVSINAYKDIPSQYKAVIIVTDGDNLEGDPLAMAQKAKDLGIKIYTIGIGTKEGELIQVSTEQGKKIFLKDSSGNYIKSRLNENLLKKIALKSEGVYVKSGSAQFGLDLLYDQNLSQLEKRDVEEKMDKKYYERFQFPLGLALLLLAIETCLGFKKK
ncbi:hypothetical protein MNBD_BACTEROID05-84 [hydrothermal vent metagenome]|uniref:VWFA domain-containing protein n=1 Tax=hydrothermal vent metagenome TaxID=652676 RepID=A0A3B0TF81_9ZZZZ